MSIDYNKRTRNFDILLYTDNDEHMKALENINQNKGDLISKYCGIIHNNDIYEETTDLHNEGDIKKEHIHLVVSLKNGKTRSAYAKHLGINETAIEPCEKFKGSLMYLIHYNTDKYQYDPQNLFGSTECVSYICEIAQRDNKALCFKLMCDFIDSVDKPLSISEFGSICYQNGWYSVLKSSQLFFIKALEEHNRSFY